MQDLKGRVAVVTGAASGIGLALANKFASMGMRVVMADVEAAALDQAVAKVVENGATEVLPFVVDVSDGAQVRALREATLERFGGVHVVCNNAGVGGRATPLWKHSERDWAWVLGVNLWGVIHGVSAFLPDLMAQDEGHIVNTASIAGLVSMGHLGAYNVSKHGVVTLSETLFAELKGNGSRVGVSVLCPGAVNTRIHESGRNRPDDLRNPAREMTDAQRERAKQAQEQVGAMLAAGLAPDEVAAQVVDAIVGDRFYVLTHPEIKPALEQRMREIVEGKNPGTGGL